ncbi:transcription-repair coupling factor, partial [Streptococcus danieliae]|nr:transcription-repair coupling factor [Streptococcus danieliae]
FEIKENSVEIKLNVNAYIPTDYISNDSDKLYFYKELAKSDQETEIFELAEEMIDRFSDYGSEIENLLDITLIRIIAEKINVESIKELS